MVRGWPEATSIPRLFSTPPCSPPEASQLHAQPDPPCQVRSHPRSPVSTPNLILTRSHPDPSPNSSSAPAPPPPPRQFPSPPCPMLPCAYVRLQTMRCCEDPSGVDQDPPTEQPPLHEQGCLPGLRVWGAGVAAREKTVGPIGAIENLGILLRHAWKRRKS